VIYEVTEGWYDPVQEFYEFPADTRCFKYIFFLPDEQCVQLGTVEEPRVYWLDLQASLDVNPDQVAFGWKSAIPPHWNDDAVWADGAQPPVVTSGWLEMRYPVPHPLAGHSFDLAFAVYGRSEVDTCALQLPGDFDNDGDIDNDDLTQLTAFVQGVGTAPPIPANGDVNGDCRINDYDVRDLSDYLDSGLPVPVECTCVNPYPFRDCCIGKVGNVNLDPGELVTIGDISLAIDHLFITEPDLPCATEADVNQSGGLHPVTGPGGDITIGDISLLIDHLFIAGPDVLILNDCLE
jgi:hypothetical protein